jgi:hypothetical protein
MAQAVEYLPSKREALSSNPMTTEIKKKKKKVQHGGGWWCTLIPALGRQRQEIRSWKPDWATQQEPKPSADWRAMQRPSADFKKLSQ